ncbi:MAG TPA: hypothetical protein DDZ68_11995, partial [Parvularcula sp.]|nr:hypothetical protein [Parvularcula sp.]
LRRVIEHFKKQEWTAIALDFLIVVAGILIAFRITEWNEVRRDRARERDYLERIAAELEHTIVEIEDAIRISHEREEMGRFLIRSVDEPALVNAEPGRFVKAVVQAGYTFSPTIRAHTFEEMKSAGDLAIFRDKALLFDISEFYTEVQGSAQWNYLRELVQTEYTKRRAGILTNALTPEAMKLVETAKVSPEDAEGAYARMLERPAFIEWLPIMSNRGDDLRLYGNWLSAATDLRTRILTGLGEGPRADSHEEPQQ